MIWIRIWAYLAATTGLGLTIYLIMKDRRRWKLACWIGCLSLLIFAGGSIQIEKLSASVSDSFNFRKEITGITNQLAHLRVDVDQAISVKQEVSQTVNVITKVEKQVADIRDTITQLYSRVRTDTFSASETNKRCTLTKPDGAIVFAFQLSACPVQKSIQGIWANRMLYPTSVRGVDNVQLTVFGKDNPPTGDAFSITYLIDPERTHIFEKMEVAENTLFLDGQPVSTDSLP